MRTVVLGDRPADLDALIARRRALGQDLFDEVWDGDYHMATAPPFWPSLLEIELMLVLGAQGRRPGLHPSGQFNLGEEYNFRVPDGGLHRTTEDAAWLSTAAMVVEVVSPHDESWLKFDHYAAHHVDEVLIADPRERSIHLFALADDRYEPTDRSALLGVSVAELIDAISWPGGG